MTVDEIYQVVAKQKPPVVYVSGKTSTGKSTFGRKLRDAVGYQVIELEAVLLDIVKKRELDEQSTFRKAFRDDGESEEKTLFFEATDRIISNTLAQDNPVVIEGAIANTDTLQRVLQPATNLLFIYFHPSDLNVYIRNLTERFMQSDHDSYGGLPLTLWQLIDDDEFKEFCRTRTLTDGLKDAIKQYAQTSQNGSLVRLDECRQKFKDIIVVEIQ